MNYKSLFLFVVIACAVGLSGCDAKPIESAVDASCTDICLEQPSLVFKASVVSAQQASLTILHKSGKLESNHAQVTIEPLSANASKLTYTLTDEPRNLGMYNDSIDLKLSTLTNEFLVATQLPVEYEWYRNFNITIAGFDGGPVDYNIPANVPVKTAMALGLITGENSTRIVGTYADWQVTEVSPGLVIYPLAGKGDADINVSLADDYQQSLERQTPYFSIVDKHSGVERRTYLSINTHKYPIMLSTNHFSGEVLPTTVLEDLSWQLDIRDTTAGLFPSRQVYWEFVDIPEGFSIEPASGFSNKNTSVVIRRSQPLSGKDFGKLQFPIQLRDQDKNILDEMIFVDLYLYTETPRLSNVSPLRINKNAISTILLSVADGNHDFNLTVNGELVDYDYFKKVDDFDVGEMTLSVANGSVKAIDDRIILQVVEDNVYKVGVINLESQPTKMLYQSSSQSVLALTAGGNVIALDSVNGRWIKTGCVGANEILDIERTSDRLFAISAKNIYDIKIQDAYCEFESKSLISARFDVDYAQVQPDLDFTKISFNGDNLVFEVDSEEDFYLTYAWPIFFGERFYVEFNKSFFQTFNHTRLSEDRLKALDFSHEPFNSNLEKFQAASLSYNGDKILLPNGDLFGSKGVSLYGGYELTGHLFQSATDNGILNQINSDGTIAWRLHKNDSHLWLSEYVLASADASGFTQASKTIELDWPEGFEWQPGDFINAQVLPKNHVLLITLNQWMWTVPLK